MSTWELLGDVIDAVFGASNAPGDPGGWTTGGAAPAAGSNAGGGDPEPDEDGGWKWPWQDAAPEEDAPDLGRSDDDIMDRATAGWDDRAMQAMDMAADAAARSPSPGPGGADMYGYAKAAAGAAEAAVEAMKREQKINDYLGQDFTGDSHITPEDLR